MTSQLYVVEETEVPGEKHLLIPSHWQLSHLSQPGLEPCSGERQLAMSGNTSDHLAIKAGPG